MCIADHCSCTAWQFMTNGPLEINRHHPPVWWGSLHCSQLRTQYTSHPIYAHADTRLIWFQQPTATRSGLTSECPLPECCAWFAHRQMPSPRWIWWSNFWWFDWAPSASWCTHNTGCWANWNWCESDILYLADILISSAWFRFLSKTDSDWSQYQNLHTNSNTDSLFLWTYIWYACRYYFWKCVFRKCTWAVTMN